MNEIHFPTLVSFPPEEREVQSVGGLLSSNELLHEGIRIRSPKDGKYYLFKYTQCGRLIYQISAFEEDSDLPIGSVNFCKNIDADNQQYGDISYVESKLKRKKIATILKSLAKSVFKNEGVELVSGDVPMFEVKLENNKFILGKLEETSLGAFISGVKSVDLTQADSFEHAPFFDVYIDDVHLRSLDFDIDLCRCSLNVDLKTNLHAHRCRPILVSQDDIKIFFRSLSLPSIADFKKFSTFRESAGVVYREMRIPFTVSASSC